MARLKGPSRPVNTLADRAAVIAALSMVDAADQVVGADIVQSAGGEVALIALPPGRSATATLTRATAMGVPIAANGGGRSAAG